ncbi:MAG TPA: hypothetical protein VJX70_09620 [Candidatus Acidoferrum sp.]|nr:hypothetical protein [Candidatus Acidoferrum sp.]
MSIEKKSLISTLKTTKKVNAVSSDLTAKPTNVSSKRELKREVLSHRAEMRRATSRKEILTKKRK